MSAVLMFATGGNKYFRSTRVKNGKFKRISEKKCRNLDNPKKNKTIGQVKPKIGDKVIIIKKPYYQDKCFEGIVMRVLTKKEKHTRGHKVKINRNGEEIIGRVLKIIK